MLQPLDVVLIKPLNDRMRHTLMSWMCTDDNELTKGGNMKRPSLSIVTTWVKEAWEDIPAGMVKKSFLETGISNSMDGTEDNHMARFRRIIITRRNLGQPIKCTNNTPKERT